MSHTIFLYVHVRKRAHQQLSKCRRINSKSIIPTIYISLRNSQKFIHAIFVQLFQLYVSMKSTKFLVQLTTRRTMTFICYQVLSYMCMIHRLAHVLSPIYVHYVYSIMYARRMLFTNKDIYNAGAYTHFCVIKLTRLILFSIDNKVTKLIYYY